MSQNIEYQRGVEDASAAWKQTLRDAYPKLEFTGPTDFVFEMEKHVGRMEDAALARAMHELEQKHMSRAAAIVRLYMGRIR